MPCHTACSSRLVILSFIDFLPHLEIDWTKRRRAATFQALMQANGSEVLMAKSARRNDISEATYFFH